MKKKKKTDYTQNPFQNLKDRVLLYEGQNSILKTEEKGGE
jgi:hypothetical protein